MRRYSLLFLFIPALFIQSHHFQYPGQIFKLSTFETASHWLIVGAGPQFAEDIRRASDDQLCNVEPSIELLQMDYTMGRGDNRHRNGGHLVTALQGPMTRNIATCFAEVQDEISVSIKEVVPPSEGRHAHIPTMYKLADSSMLRLGGLPSNRYCPSHHNSVNQSLLRRFTFVCVTLTIYPFEELRCLLVRP